MPDLLDLVSVADLEAADIQAGSQALVVDGGEIAPSDLVTDVIRCELFDE